MIEKAIQDVIGYGIDHIDYMIENDATCDPSDLHNQIYNEDYFIIGTYQAEQFLATYGTFKAIEEIRAYEQENFGEVNTDFSDAERVVNMFAYIKGEQALGQCDTLQGAWDKPELDKDDLLAIRAELEAQL